MKAPHFITLDLELTADGPLDALALHFERTSLVLFHGRVPNGYLLVLEPEVHAEPSPDVQECTDHFLAAVRSLSPELRSIWNSCSSRVFDYGFDSGIEQPPLRVVLPFSSLLEISSERIDVQVSLYPVCETADGD